MPTRHATNGQDLESLVDLRSLPQFRRIHGNDFIDRLRQCLPFDYVTVSGLDLDGYRLGQDGFHIESDAPPALVEVYLADELYKSDPLLHHVRDTGCVAIESLVYNLPNLPSRLIELAELFDIKNRTVFPVRRGDLVVASVCFMRKHPFIAQELEFLGQVADPIYKSVVGPIIVRFAAESAKLTAGEVICLRLASHGLTTQEMSEESGFLPNTIDSYLKSAIKKLKCRNRTHAIADAMRREII